MKLIIVGDIHGRTTWKDIVNKEKDFDKFIFIGDYFDSFDIPGDKQIENFLDIIEFKKSNIDKVIVMIGNHDYHYMDPCDGRYSGYQDARSWQIMEVLKSNMEHLQMCYVHDNIVFTHAGLTKTWCDNNNVDVLNIEQSINDLWAYKPGSFNFQIGANRSYTGDDVTQGPLWVRPFSLATDGIDNYKQVVGHTYQPSININGQCIHIDVLDTKPEYLIYDDGKFNIGLV